MGTVTSRDGWEARGSWRNDEIRREVFYVRSGGEQLYGSTYAATEPRSPWTFLVCSSWSSDARLVHEAQHQLALRLARLGATITLFDYPGHGESTGDPDTATFPRLLEAASDIMVVAPDTPPDRWIPVGIGLGASVAFLLARRLGSTRIGLLQPALDPARYFARLRRRGARGALRGEDVEGHSVAMGVPISEAVVESARRATPEALASIDGFSGRGACVRFARPEIDGSLPAGVEDVVVPGTWGLAHRLGELLEASVERLEKLTG